MTEVTALTWIVAVAGLVIMGALMALEFVAVLVSSVSTDKSTGPASKQRS